MLKMLRSWTALTVILLTSLACAAAAEDSKTFQLRGLNPDGKAGYTGSVEVRKEGETMAVRWLTGPKQDETLGFAIEGEETLGAGYGGSALYAVAVYELVGKTIKATWAMTSKPGTVGKYELKGSDAFKGAYKFADGTRGSVTMTPTGGGRYKMAWDLESGHFEGIGVKIGNALVAVSGEPGGLLGVAGYRRNGGGAEGVWTTSGLKGVGKEVWSAGGGETPAAAAASNTAAASKDGKTITFGGEDYVLQDNQSAPGRPTSELREYLRAGENWEGYRKMVALRLMAKPAQGDASTLAKGALEETKKQFPDSYLKEVLMEPDHAVIFFIVLSGEQAEMNLFDYRRTASGIPSFQFVLRNKAPYETKDKFKAEQDAHYDSWLAEAAALSARADELLAVTAKAEAAAPAAEKTEPPPKKEPVSPELVDKIQGDLQKCSGLAEQFITQIKAGNLPKAVALMGEKAFVKTSQAQFVGGLAKSNQALGQMQTFTPDRDATDFGVVDGVMTFTLQGNGQYANGATRETLRFIKSGAGVELVDYRRAKKE